MIRLTHRKLEYDIFCFLLHIVPGFIIDSLAKLIGKQPQYVERQVNSTENLLFYLNERFS